MIDRCEDAVMAVLGALCKGDERLTLFRLLPRYDDTGVYR